jgi:hypothetical protein
VVIVVFANLYLSELLRELLDLEHLSIGKQNPGQIALPLAMVVSLLELLLVTIFQNLLMLYTVTESINHTHLNLATKILV